MENLNEDQKEQFKKLIRLYKKLEKGHYKTYYRSGKQLYVFEGGRRNKNGVFADDKTIEAFEDYIR